MKPREPLVLIIGANDEVGEVESLLTAHGFMTARAPRVGLLSEVRRLSPDVVVAGEDSAEEITSALVADEASRSTPIVIIGRPAGAGAEVAGRPSAAAAAVMPFRLLDEPYLEYLAPPFTPGELAACLNGAARVKRLRDEVCLREQALRRVALRDRVTDVFTWAYGLERVKQEVARGKRYSYAVSCLRLKAHRTTDAPAAALSDDALRQVAALLLRLTREADIVCRSNADRFMVLLPQTDRSGLEVLAERVRLAVERHRFTEGTAEAKLGVFVGAATFPSPEVSGAGSLVRRAAEAVHLAQQGGRGRVVVL
ncbi:MAG: GGDEF domain-containing protein [Bacillota bacterium]